jgi:hypothetical protein
MDQLARLTEEARKVALDRFRLLQLHLGFDRMPGIEKRLGRYPQFYRREHAA